MQISTLINLNYKSLDNNNLDQEKKFMITNPANFQKIQPVFMKPMKPCKSLVLWHENNPYKSRLSIPESGLASSGFASPILADSVSGFDS
jgi:hypothetical protein